MSVIVCFQLVFQANLCADLVAIQICGFVSNSDAVVLQWSTVPDNWLNNVTLG